MLKPSRFMLALALASLSIAAPRLVLAEGGQDVGATPSVSARVNFAVNVPAFIRFRVGSPSTTQDTITFDFTGAGGATALADAVLAGTSLPGTGGDLSNGEVTVQLVANIGNVTITAVTDGTALTDGGTNTILYEDITTTVTTGTLTPPTLQAGNSTVNVTATSGAIVENGSWTYTYTPSSLPAAANYTGFVVYTAAPTP